MTTPAFDTTQCKREKVPFTQKTRLVFKTKPEDVPIGTNVIYWPAIGENGPLSEGFESQVTSESWELGHGAPVVKIKGRTGGICLTHLQLTPASNEIESRP